MLGKVKWAELADCDSMMLVTFILMDYFISRTIEREKVQNFLEFALEHLIDGHVLAIQNYDIQRMLLKRQLLFAFFACLLLEKVALHLSVNQLNQVLALVLVHIARRLTVGEQISPTFDLWT
jgi:hypothetical protein